MKVKCRYCGIVKHVPPSRVKNKNTYYCGSTECREKHMKRIGRSTKKKDFSQLKKLNNIARIWKNKPYKYKINFSHLYNTNDKIKSNFN